MRKDNICKDYNNNFLKTPFFLAALRGLWDLSSPTRDRTRAPLQWKRGVLTTGPPGNSQKNLLTHETGIIIFSPL